MTLIFAFIHGTEISSFASKPESKDNCLTIMVLFVLLVKLQCFILKFTHFVVVVSFYVNIKKTTCLVWIHAFRLA